MSSIIDDLIFYRPRQPPTDSPLVDLGSEGHIASSFWKQLHLNQGALLLTNNTQCYEVSNKLKIHQREYWVRLLFQKQGRSVKVQARSLQEALFAKIGSRQNQLLFLKQIARRQFQFARESTYFIHRGSAEMVQQIHLCLSERSLKQKLGDFCNLIFSRNLNEFSLFLTKHLDRHGLLNIGQPQNRIKLKRDLLLAQTLASIPHTLHQPEEKMNFKQAETTLSNKRVQIKSVINHINRTKNLQKSLQELYERGSGIGKSQWLEENLESAFNNNQGRLAALLLTARQTGDKKIDDYIFNMVMVDLKESMAKPFSEGGSCQLFIAKAQITFISSHDSTCYFQNQEKKQKLIAVKKLKPQFQKRFAYKLEHQKKIVAQLKGSCSYLIPKYYRQDKSQDRPDTLLMEYIQGEQLDFFVMSRHQTISLTTKLCILLNIAHGLRFLAGYEISHLDLKPINVMVCKYLMTKIIDYGQAYHKKVCTENYCPGYTFPYVAPEVYLNYHGHQHQKEEFDHSEKQDVFAFGMIMLEIFFNSRPFQFTQQKFKQVYSHKTILQHYFLVWERLQLFGDSRIASTMTYLITLCLDPDPMRRPRFDWIAVVLKLILNYSTSS